MKYILTVIFFLHGQPYLGDYTIAYTAQEPCLSSMQDLNQWAEGVNTIFAKTFFACLPETSYTTLSAKLPSVH